jgi:spore coat assembly protein SafA
MRVNDTSPKNQSRQPQKSQDSYTVKPGDSMWAIAQAHGVALSDLEKANPQIKNPSLIFAGQEVKIPGQAPSAAETAPEKRAKQDTSKRKVPPPAAGVDPAKIQAAVKDKGGPGNDLVPNQFSLPPPDGGSACGPAALVAIAKAKGKDISLPAARDAALNQGLWDAGAGMHGFGAFETLAKNEGLSFQSGSQSDIQAQVEKGNPVVISTAQHYFVAQAYDPSTGKFFFGNSGTALKAGSQWLSLDQVASLGRGINGVGWAD